MKKKIYQVNVGGYDRVHEHKLDGAEFKYVTDVKESTGDSFLDSRIAKFDPPWPVEEGALILYIDGAFQITEEGIQDWMEDQIQDYDMVFNASFNVEDCYQEGKRVLLRGIGDPDIIIKQLEDYKSEGVQGENNHAYGGIFVFRDSIKTRKFLQDWKDEFLRYPSRDQIALHKLRQQTELNHGWMNPYTVTKLFQNHGYKYQFTYHPNHQWDNSIKINYIIGWDTQKGVGASLNRQIERIPEDEWICVMDGDVMFLTDFWGKQLEACIRRYPDTAIFGAYTNRIGLEYQLDYDFSEDMDILSHKEIAEERAMILWDTCERIDNTVAGFLQLFPKTYWNDNPYPDTMVVQDFSEDVPFALFDWVFCQKAIQEELPIRLMEGVYVFHGYRLDEATQNQAKSSIQHLL